MENKTNNPVAVEERLYRWVKASDRKPEANKKLPIRVHGLFYVGYMFDYGDNLFHINNPVYDTVHPNNADWLEEIPIKEHLPVVEDGAGVVVSKAGDDELLIYKKDGSGGYMNLLIDKEGDIEILHIPNNRKQTWNKSNVSIDEALEYFNQPSQPTLLEEQPLKEDEQELRRKLLMEINAAFLVRDHTRKPIEKIREDLLEKIISHFKK